MGEDQVPQQAVASVVTFKAVVSEFSSTYGGGGVDPILDAFGIVPSGSLEVYFTIETDQSNGSTETDTGTELKSTYFDLRIVGPTETIVAAPSDGNNHQLFTRDFTDEVRSSDLIQLRSALYFYDPNSYNFLGLTVSDQNHESWNRADPITAALLNSMSYTHFGFDRWFPNEGENGREYSISSTNITFYEVAAVPLPAGIWLLLTSLAALLGLGSRRRRLETTAKAAC